MDMETIIDTYGDDLLRLCLLYLGERQLAEDAFQTALIRAWKSLPGFRGESSMKTWLSRIAVNVCRDTLRSGWFRMRKQSESIDALRIPVNTASTRLRRARALLGDMLKGEIEA